MADVGPHTVTLLVTLASYPTITAASVTFTATLNDPCPTTVISMTSPVAMTNTILAIGVTQTAPNPTNSVSLWVNAAFCGAYTFALSGTYPYLTINSSTGLLTLASSSLADVGPHTVTLLVTLTSYPTVTAASVTFTATLNDPCPTTSIAMTAPAAMTNGVTLPAVT
jgi:hypothetical protein